MFAVNSKILTPPQYRKIDPKVPNTKYLIAAEIPPYTRPTVAKIYNVKLKPSRQIKNNAKSSKSSNDHAKQATRYVIIGTSGLICAFFADNELINI
jgi:hypothetical protein